MTGLRPPHQADPAARWAPGPPLFANGLYGVLVEVNTQWFPSQKAPSTPLADLVNRQGVASMAVGVKGARDAHPHAEKVTPRAAALRGIGR